MFRITPCILAVAATLAATTATTLLPTNSSAQDLTGTWDVKAHFCETLSGGPSATTCSLTGPAQIQIQSLDAYRFLVRTSTSGPSNMKCILVPPLKGKTMIGCARCGSGDLYQALEVDDGDTFAEVWSGKLLAADKFKINGVSVQAFDFNGAPGVQPGTEIVRTQWSAKQLDALSSGLTDCSTP